MNKKNVVIFFLAGFLFSCSNESGRTVDARTDDASRIVSAAIYPGKATANTTLIAQYRAGGREAGYIFRWYVDGEIVQEGTAGTLEPGKIRKGSEVFAEIFPENSSGAGGAFRTKTVVIGNQPAQLASVAISPSEPKKGDQLTAVAEGTDPDGDEIRYSYQWFVNEKAVAEPGENKSFSTDGLRKRDSIYVVVTPFDSDDAGGESKSSNVIRLPNSSPEITSTPGYDINEGWYSYQVEAKDPDGDKITFTLIKSPNGMAIDAGAGLIRWKVPKQIDAKQEVPVKIKADDGDGGIAYQEYSLLLEAQ